MIYVSDTSEHLINHVQILTCNFCKCKNDLSKSGSILLIGLLFNVSFFKFGKYAKMS